MKDKIKIFKHSSVNMSEVTTGSVHLVVTSPPYPMIEKWDKLFGVVDFAKQHRQLDAVWKECYRVLVKGGILCVNIGDATRSIDNSFQCFPNYARIALGLCKLGFIHLIPIYWKKVSNRPNAFLGSGFLPTNGYVSQDCEYIAIFRKGKQLRKFPVKDKTRYESQFTRKERDLWFRQIWEIKGATGAKKTSAFPTAIPQRLIRMFSIIGDIVVDPFAGTGTTGKVAMELKRKFIGYTL